MAVPEHHIREAVARYVSGEITQEELQQWFAPIAWELIEGDPSPAADLAAELELIFAESTSEGWTDSQLREQLLHTAAIPFGRLVHLESSLSVYATGGPLQNTVVAHQSTFWIDVSKADQINQAA